MFSLDEMIEVKGVMAMVRGFKELLRGIDTEPSLDPATSEELYTAACELFSQTIKETLCNKALLLWSDTDFVSVYAHETSKECEAWIKEAERLFEENPIPDSNDSKMTEFERRNRFAKEITFEQFCELAKNEFDNPHNYSVTECGLEFVFEDRSAVVNARAAGKL